PGFPVRYAHFMRLSGLELPLLAQNLFLTENSLLASRLIRQATRDLTDRRIDGLIWGHGQAGVKAGNRLPPGGESFTTRAWRAELRSIMRTEKLEAPGEEAVLNHSNACITGITALAEAMRRIRAGRWGRALVLVQEMRCRDWVLWP